MVIDMWHNTEYMEMFSRKLSYLKYITQFKSKRKEASGMNNKKG